MNYLCKAQAYLNGMTTTVSSLAEMVISDQFRNDPEILQYLIVTILELEQETADFIDRMQFFKEFPTATVISKRKLIRINERLISHIKKIQSQNGTDYSKLTTALKLENETLNKEINFI